MESNVRYDDQHHTGLVGTLEAYLNQNCNMNATAAAIYTVLRSAHASDPTPLVSVCAGRSLRTAGLWRSSTRI